MARHQVLIGGIAAWLGVSARAFAMPGAEVARKSKLGTVWLYSSGSGLKVSAGRFTGCFLPALACVGLGRLKLPAL